MESTRKVFYIRNSISRCDLIDFILENDRWKKIGPINEIKSAIFTYTKGYSDFCPKNIELVHEKFKNVGTCMVTDLLSPQEFEQLSQYYLPWYWPDTKEQIRFDQYINQFMNGNVNLKEYQKLTKLAESLKLGWDNEIEIIIAFDTILNVGVVVDGTHHSLALSIIKEENDELLAGLLNHTAPVKHCKMSSMRTSSIFHEDFKFFR